MRKVLQTALLLVVPLVHADSPAIGTALTSGAFRINGSEVKGNASLFEGTLIETSKASSKLRLSSARLELAVNSQARVFGDHTVLQKGAAQLESGSAYDLNASALTISPDTQAVARVEMQTDRVLISAISGSVRVMNSKGLLVAKLPAGANFYFRPQTSAENGFDITGCVLQKDKKFIIVDPTTSQVFELRGAADLTPLLGNRGQIKGKASVDPKPISGAAQAIQVESSSLQAPGGCLAVASTVGADPLPGTVQTGKNKKKATAGAAGGAAAGAATGISTGVIVGVAVAAAGGTAAAVVLSHSSSNKSP